jgi:ABC-type Mn2+/Zn2+ transport system ATPase subunit
LSAGALLVALRGAAVGYGRRPLLTGVELSVRAGDFLGIVGPNGGGKTTVLRALLGALAPLAGRRELPAPLAVGYVPQRDLVDPIWPLTAEEVARMGRARLVRPGRRLGPADREAVQEALARAGVRELAGRPYRELSGGERQRTLIARALAAEPALLALDEPTNGMDPAGEEDVMELLDALNRERGLAVVMVSHRLDVVARHAAALCYVDQARGVVRTGPAGEMLAPEALAALFGRPVRLAGAVPAAAAAARGRP